MVVFGIRCTYQSARMTLVRLGSRPRLVPECPLSSASLAHRVYHIPAAMVAIVVSSSIHVHALSVYSSLTWISNKGHAVNHILQA